MPLFSFEPAAPTTARTLLFDASACAPASAWAEPLAAPSCVSCCDTTTLAVGCALFHWFTTYLFQRTCCWPIEAAGPVAGTRNPIVRVPLQLTADADDVAVPAVLAEPTDAATATPTRAVTATNNFFILVPPGRSGLRRRQSAQSL